MQLVTHDVRPPLQWECSFPTLAKVDFDLDDPNYEGPFPVELGFKDTVWAASPSDWLQRGHTFF